MTKSGIFHIRTATLAVLLLLPLNLFAGINCDRRSRKELIRENAALQSTVDSLKGLQKQRDTVYITKCIERKATWKDLLGIPDSTADFHPESPISAAGWETSYPAGKTPDSVYVQRLESLDSPISLPYNSVVRSCLISYSERNSKEMARIIGLCGHYMPVFEEIFDKYGLPLELTSLAIIESRLNPKATSKAGAKGLWQFMFASAKAYGLEISSYVDERMDVYKSTDAAARYLRDAYREFRDWPLAVSAYNCGYGNVRKAIKLAGGKTDYWSIYPYLPQETRSYLPAMVAALYTLRYHNELGIVPTPCTIPDNIDTVHIRGKLNLSQVSETIGTDIGTLRCLNPQFKHDIIPSNGKEYVLRLPEEDALAFTGRQDEVASYKADKYLAASVIRSIENSGTGQTIVYKVKQGDSLYTIGKHYGVSVSQLRKWNRISGTLIKPGQKLYIYR